MDAIIDEVQSHFSDAFVFNSLNEQLVDQVFFCLRDVAREKKSCSSLLLVANTESTKELNKLVYAAFEKYAQSSQGKDQLQTVWLDGAVHRSDRLALRSMAEQLSVSVGSMLDDSQVDTSGDEGCDDKSFNVTMTDELCHPTAPQSSSFSDKFQFVMDGLRQLRESSNNSVGKATVVVLQRFELFTTHTNQLLLYNLFDVTHNQRSPLCVIGLANRKSAVEMLEKRVKSRFSQRVLNMKHTVETFEDYLKMAKMLLSVTVLMEEKENHPNPVPSRAASTRKAAMDTKESLWLNSPSFNRKAKSKCALKPSPIHVKWNVEVEEWLKQSDVQDVLKRAYNRNGSPCSLKNVLRFPVATLTASNPHLQLMEGFHMKMSTKPVGGYKNELCQTLSEEELWVLASLNILQRPRKYDGRPVNFEMVFEEYRNHIMGKEVRKISKAAFLQVFECLLCHGLIVAAPPGSQVVALGATGAPQKSSANNSNLLAFKPVTSDVSIHTLLAAISGREISSLLQFWMMETASSREYCV